MTKKERKQLDARIVACRGWIADIAVELGPDEGMRCLRTVLASEQHVKGILKVLVAFNIYTSIQMTKKGQEAIPLDECPYLQVATLIASAWFGNKK